MESHMRMHYLALLVILSTHCVSTAQYNGTLDTGKLRGAASVHRLPGEYVLVMDCKGGQHSDHVQAFLSDMTSQHPESKLLDTYVIGHYVALRIILPEAEAGILSEHPAIRVMQANMEVRATQDYATCEQEHTGSELWGLSRVSTRQLRSYSSADYTYLINDGDSTIVYVLDTGVQDSHEEFQGRASHGFTATSIVNSGEQDIDLHGHGTHVSGTIAGATYGLAKKAQIIAVKVLNANGVGSTADIIEGVEFVYNDFKARRETTGSKVKAVVNMSLGGPPFAVGSADEAAIMATIQYGVPFVIAAGNDAFDACFTSPGRISAAITVGASNTEDVMSSFSNYGPCVDILAPGEKILSSFIGPSDSEAAISSGTSMAAPHVTGVVARYLSQQAVMQSPASVKAWLQDAATTGILNIGQALATPNSLLFMACTADESLEPWTASASRTSLSDPWHKLSQEDRWLIVVGILVGILILCIFILIASCCAWHASNRASKVALMASRSYMTYVSHPQPSAPCESSPLLA